jgi:uncharacterized membrane protein YedE/YeeE
MRPLSLLAVLACGAMFGFGLALSTMVQPEIVLNFLRLHDYGLLLVLGAALAVTLAAYQLAPRSMAGPVLEAAFDRHMPASNRDTIIGAAIFGAGWGMSGVCPGAALAGLGAGNWPLAWAVLGLAAGVLAYGRFFGRQ